MTTTAVEITTKSKFLCNLCDCVSIGNKGDPSVQQIFTKYPYANCYAERNATKKSVPGTHQIKGDGKKNRFVVNMITQFYPGAPKYPNDNLGKRQEWFRGCLDKLIEITDVESVAFPPDIGLYESADHQEKYLNTIDDFRKKYYLKHSKMIKIVDYQDRDLTKIVEKKEVVYDNPIGVLKITDLDELEEPSATQSPASQINIVKRFKIEDLCYLSPKPSAKPMTTVVPSPASTPVSAPAPAPVKPKIGFKLKQEVPQPTPVPQSAPEPVQVPQAQPETVQEPPQPPQSEPVQEPSQPVQKPPSSQPEPVPAPQMPMRTYDKNPTWTHTICDLASLVDPSWDPIFKDPKIVELLTQIDQDFVKEMESFGDAIEVLPIPQENIFNAFKKCQFPPKVCLIGQDPYPDQLNQAMGLSFSIPTGVKFPPSLDNIFQEISTDIEGFMIPKSGDLTPWAEQGVLLLNSALTVRYKYKLSHMKIWKNFTDTIIQMISQKSPKPVVFMLWGNFAKEKKSLIANPSRHSILEATHPSPLGANKGGWFGCKHFSKCNDFLIKNRIKTIDWKLVSV